MNPIFIDKQVSDGFTAFLGSEALRGPFELTYEEKYDIIHALVDARMHDEAKENPFQGIYPAMGVGGSYTIGHVIGSPLALAVRTSGIREREFVMQQAQNYNYETIYGDFDHKKRHPLCPSTISPNDYPFDERYFPADIQVEGQPYGRNRQLLLHAPAGGVMGSLTAYTSAGGRTFMVPGRMLAPQGVDAPSSIYKYTLVPGVLIPPYLLWNEHKLEHHPHPTVFFCENVLTALALDNIIEDASRFEHGTFVATALTIRSELAAYVDYRGLWRKHVVFIPSPNRRGHSRTLEIEGLCHKAGCASFSILRAPVLLSSGKEVESVSMADPWEQYMADNAIMLPDEESTVLTRMKAHAVQVGDYIQWAVSVGLLRKYVEEVQPGLCRSEGFVPPTPEEIERITSCEIHTDAVASRQEVGVIIAEQNVGKTQLAVGFSVARASGKSVLIFEAMEPEVVLLCENESVGGRLKASTHRSAMACGADMDLLSKNLRLRCLRNERHKPPLDLSEPYLQGLLEAEIQTYKVKLLVLDNLIALLPGFRRKGGSKWQDAWAWIRKMEEKYGIAILIVHHSNAEGSGAGTLDIETQCQNVIYLEDPRRQKKGSPDVAFGPYLAPDKSGVLLRVTFSKCKRYPHLEGKSFGAHLAYEPETPTEGPPWEFIDLEAEHGQPSLMGESYPPAPADDTQGLGAVDPAALWPDRTEEERLILLNASGVSRFTRKDVESLLECKSSKAGDLLTDLCRAGLLVKLGSGRSVQYEYVPR